ncbi:hypothetical protein ANCDUO_25962 [Ancylostoma duodenale]|uniref:PXA domain-containing protein n=1 Tax=Ancylostoma duodenale TaxID=51022 RepID=A0A0C2FB54_9BILA|nr:hypothetical protein ANCDUO_25962 [Ancylostoma duodenale]
MHRIIKYEDDLSEKVADFLTIKLLDDTHLAGRAHDDDGPSGLGERASMSTWPSQSVRHFLRELIVNALLLPSLDLIADPDTINHLLIMTFDAQKGEGGDAEQSCDSNVLRDARQYSTFRLYLQDTRGPVNELCFLAEASRIHDSMQRKVCFRAHLFIISVI